MLNASRHQGKSGMDMMVASGSLNARFYDPAIGRFISPDPAPVDIAKPITFNRYDYANDNPYKYKDKDGKAPDGFEQVIGFGLGFNSGWNAGKKAGYGTFGKFAMGTVGGTVGWGASFVSAAFSRTVAKVGAGAITKGIAYVAGGTLTRGLGNKVMSGNYNLGSAFFQSLGGYGVRALNTGGQSLKGLPFSGKALISGHIAVGEAAIDGVIHNTDETNHTTNARSSTNHGNTNSKSNSDDHSDGGDHGSGGDHDH